MNQSSYATETTTALFQGKPITLTHRTPVFSPHEREKRKKDIELQLFDVFAKSGKK
jgi:hypothetical protein